MCVQLVPLTSAAASYDYTSARKLLNNAKLYPQKTGYQKLDARVAELISSFRKNASDTFDLVVAAYDWLVYNVTYDRTITYYPNYDFNSRRYCPVPFYAVYFAYDPLFMREGVCDNFSSAFVVMARAIGLDAYLISGTQVTSSQTYSHVWTEIVIDGVPYIFDPQSDNSVYKSQGKNRHLYFGRPSSSSDMVKMYRPDSSRTPRFKAASTPVDQTPEAGYCYITYAAGGDGKVTDNGLTQSQAQMKARVELWNRKNYSHQFAGYLSDTSLASFGTSVTLKATPSSGAQFLGWYIGSKLVSQSTSYTLTAEKDTFVEALFTGEQFRDVKSGSWYHDAVYFCSSRSLMNGTYVTLFEPDAPLTRGMAVVILGKLAGADVSGYTGSSFTDVETGKWYSAYVQWAKENGIAKGYKDGRFGYADPVTREQLAVFFWALAGYLKYGNKRPADLSRFSDASQIHSWASDAMQWAYSIGLIAGTDTGKLLPLETATRAQTAVMVRKFRTAG